MQGSFRPLSVPPANQEGTGSLSLHVGCCWIIFSAPAVIFSALQCLRQQLLKAYKLRDWVKTLPDQCQGGQSGSNTCPSVSHRWHLPTAVLSLLALIVQYNQIPDSKDSLSYFLAILSWTLSKSPAVQAEDEQIQDENFAPLVFVMVQPLCFSSRFFRAMSVLTIGHTWDGITLFSLFWAISEVWGFPSRITQLFSSLPIWGRVGGRLNKSYKTFTLHRVSQTEI